MLFDELIAIGSHVKIIKRGMLLYDPSNQMIFVNNVPEVCLIVDIIAAEKQYEREMIVIDIFLNGLIYHRNVFVEDIYYYFDFL